MKNVQELLSAALGFHMAVVASREDGKVELADVAYFAAPLLKLPAAISDVDQCLVELKSASDDERKVVLDALKAEYNIPDDEIEAKVEAAVEWLMATGKFLGVLQG